MTRIVNTNPEQWCTCGLGANSFTTSYCAVHAHRPGDRIRMRCKDCQRTWRWFGYKNECPRCGGQGTHVEVIRAGIGAVQTTEGPEGVA